MAQTVHIDEVFSDVMRVRAGDLRVGDFVHDLNGNRYKLVRVTRLKDGVKTVREDGWKDYFSSDHELTIHRPD